ncbi:hypothetical protein JCM8202_006091 [Rhodotorula sphaerocarpa]
MALPDSTTVPRTLLVLFAPEALLAAPYARRILAESGLEVVHEDRLSGEELEEAGLDLGLGVGTEEQANERREGTALHSTWVVRGPDAVNRVKALRTGRLSEECPTLHTFAAPSAAAADMAVEVLFPSLSGDAADTSSPAVVTEPTPAATTVQATKPFPLSNAAFAVKQPIPANVAAAEQTKKLSPAIEKALAQVEAREEQQRLRKASQSSRGSAEGAASPLASRQPSSAGDAAERRVFTLRTASPDLEPEDSPEADLDVDAIPSTVSPTEEFDDEPAEPLESPSEALLPSAVQSTPSRSRISSALSQHSGTSSLRSSTTTSTSFRARPAPPVGHKPAIEPRLTKAAALRLGLDPPPPTTTPRRSAGVLSPPPSTRTPQTATAAPTPRSLAAPSITPRMSRAAELRLSKSNTDATATGTGPAAAAAAAAAPRVRQSISTAERAALDRARRQSAAAATAEGAAAATPAGPKVEVRMSRAALLRQGLDPGASTSHARSTAGRASMSMSTSTPGAMSPPPPASTSASRPSTAGRASLVSADLKALREPSIAPRMTKAAALRAGGLSASMGASARPSLSASTIGSARAATDRRPPSAASAASASSRASSAGGSARRTSSVVATAPPSVAPRLNRAAELRQAKMNAQATAAGMSDSSSGARPIKKKTLGERN